MQNIVINSLSGFLVCLFIGMIVFGSSIFNFQHSSSQIIVFGIYAAILFSVIRYGSRKELVFVILMAFLLNIILQGRHMPFSFLVRDSLFFFSYYLALIVYKKFIEKYEQLPFFFRAFGLALFLGMFNLVCTWLLVQLYPPSTNEISSTFYLNAFYSAIIGISLGVGFDLFEKFESRIFTFIDNNF